MTRDERRVIGGQEGDNICYFGRRACAAGHGRGNKGFRFGARPDAVLERRIDDAGVTALTRMPSLDSLIEAVLVKATFPASVLICNACVHNHLENPSFVFEGLGRNQPGLLPWAPFW
nr:hypothetical protein [Dyella choica]